MWVPKACLGMLGNVLGIQATSLAVLGMLATSLADLGMLCNLGVPYRRKTPPFSTL